MVPLWHANRWWRLFAAGEALILWSRPYLSSAGDGWSVGFLPRAGDVTVYSYAVCIIAA
jgi:hypothetical protein